MIRKLGIVVAVVASIASLGGPARAGDGHRTATYSRTTPFYYGMFHLTGAAVEVDLSATSTTQINVTCKITVLSATQLTQTVTQRCALRNVTSGTRHNLTTVASSDYSVVAQGTFVQPQDHRFELCVGVRVDHNAGTLIIDDPCTLLRSTSGSTNVSVG